MDRETLKRIVAEKKKKDSNEKSNSLAQENSTLAHHNTEINSERNVPVENNNTEENREHVQNVPNVPVSNLSHVPVPKFTGTNGTNPPSTLDTSVEFDSDKSQDNSTLAHSFKEKKRPLAHRITEINHDNPTSVEINSPQVNREHVQNVPFVPMSNSGTGKREKLDTGTNGTNSYSTPDTSVEINPENNEKLDTGTNGTNSPSTPDTSVEINPEDTEKNTALAHRNTEINSTLAHSFKEKKRPLAHRITEINSNNSVPVEKNNTEENREHMQNVPNVPVSNFSNDKVSKFTGTNGTNPSSTSNTSEEISSEDEEKSDTGTSYYREKFKTGTKNSSEEGEEIEDEDIIIKDNAIIIQTKDKHKFIIYYGLAGTVEDSTRLIDLKVPQLPKWEFVAKKKDETLNMMVVVDFYQMEGKIMYYIRNRKEIVEKLYAFRSQRHISKRLISDALDAWLDHIDPEKYVQWVDVKEVVKQYEEWDEINEDPLNFFLSRATDIVGNEKLKVAVLLNVVSSQLSKIRRGIYRVHLILSGSSGSGKSSTIKSILDLFYDNADGVEDFVVLKLTRMTKESLGRLRVDTLDGKVIFIEQLDNMEGVDYIREAMSEDRITTLTTIKDSEGNLVSKTVVIPGQPAFITTNVTANVDHQIINRSIQLYLSQAEDEKLKTKIIETILERGEIEELDKLKLITYVWLKTRPKSPKMTKDVKEELVKLLSKFINFKNIYRATEITRNLVRSTASMFNHENITMEDLNFVMSYLKKDIILTTLELSERDLQVLRWLRNHGFVQGEKEEETKDVTTSEIAQVVKMSTQETKKLLDVLYDKGLVWKAYDGKRFSWAINNYGIKVLSELEREVEEQREQKEEDEVIIEDQLLGYISSKLLGKETVTEEELRSILQKTAQATDIEVQDLLIHGLERKNIIKNQGDGTWKVV